MLSDGCDIFLAGVVSIPRIDSYELSGGIVNDAYE